MNSETITTSDLDRETDWVIDSKKLLKHIEEFLESRSIDCDDPGLVLKTTFNEAWFSNMLAWLLNPKGSHGFGVEFVREFVALIAKQRSDSNSKFSRSKSFFKWGSEGLGNSSKDLRLGNASVSREFYISSELGAQSQIGAHYCDAVLFDLDPADGLVVTIENKLFTTNHPHQLKEYFTRIESRFKKAKTREYVYLTFHGFDPIQYEGEELSHANWVTLSWVQDIRGILLRLNAKKVSNRVTELLRVLEWLNTIYTDKEKSRSEELRHLILYSGAKCLEEELNRIGSGYKGTWSISKIGARIQILHSSNPKSPLFVELLPSMSIAVQGKRSRKISFEKIVIPFGVNTDQIFNLLDITAKELYKAHFGGNASLYMNPNSKRIGALQSKTKQLVRPVFEFTSAHFEALKVLFTISRTVWEEGR